MVERERSAPDDAPNNTPHALNSTLPDALVSLACRATFGEVYSDIVLKRSWEVRGEEKRKWKRKITLTQHL